MFFIKSDNVFRYFWLSMDNLLKNACNKVDCSLALLFVIAVYECDANIRISFEQLFEMVDNDRTSRRNRELAYAHRTTDRMTYATTVLPAPAFLVSNKLEWRARQSGGHTDSRTPQDFTGLV